MRILVDIPESSLEALEVVCKRQKISRAEAIRRAVSHYLKNVEKPGNLEDFFGLWEKRHMDTDKYIARLRKGWKR